MPKITFIYGDQTQVVEAESGQKILQIGLDAGIPIEHACGGNGFCTTCLCHVKEGKEHLNERNDREENMGIAEDPERLSCQAEVEGDATVEIVNY